MKSGPLKETFFVRLLLKLGSPADLAPDERHRRIPAVVILIAGMLTMLVFIPYHLHSGNNFIALADAIALVFFLATLFYLKNTDRGVFVYWLISIVFFGVCIISVILGRTEISYFLWALVPPALFFAVLEKKGGVFMSLLFFVLVILLMTATERTLASTAYSPPVIVRYSATYIILTFILYYYEASQQMLFGYIQEEKENFEHASKTDPLTGLSNRRDMMEKIRNEQQRQMRQEKPFTLVLGDIDNFKLINDTHGHGAGDYVLRSLGQLLKDQVRGIDCPARWGGEEFLIMLIETDIEGGRTVAERIRNRIEKTVFMFNGRPLHITISLGLSEYQGVSDTLDGCIQRADHSLYAGKRQGKNRVVVG